MFAPNACPPHLLPTTPPAPSHHDKAAIVDEVDSHGDFDPDCITEPCSIDRLVNHNTEYRVSLAPPWSFQPLSLRPITDFYATPALLMDQSSVRTGSMDMQMAMSGSVAAQPGYHTPLASYAGEPISRQLTVSLTWISSNGRLAVVRHISPTTSFKLSFIQRSRRSS